MLTEISGVDISIVFYKTESRQTKASLRSKKANINALVQKFSDGGHKNATGILSNIPISKPVSEITTHL